MEKETLKQKKNEGNELDLLHMTGIPFNTYEEKIEIEKKLEGNKFDNEKLRYDLLPVDALEEIVKVFSMGAKKYGDRDWEKGLSWGRLFAALLRHIFAFWMGEDYDKESGLLHNAHVAWNAIALLTYQKRKAGIDDRIK